MDLNELTAEELKELEAKIKENKKAEKSKRQSNIAAYKSLENDFVRQWFPCLKEVSKGLETTKEGVYNSVETLLQLKHEVYGLMNDNDLQKDSRTFFSDDKNMSITVGRNAKDDWDMDIASDGLTQIHRWIDKQSAGSGILVPLVKEYLRTDYRGALDRARIADLIKKADEYYEPLLKDAAERILEGYSPSKTSTYIKAEYKDVHGTTKRLKLTMTN